MVIIAGDLDFIGKSGLINLTNNNTIFVSGHLVPEVDITYDLGRVDRKWAVLHSNSGVIDVAVLGAVTADSVEIGSTFTVLGGATSLIFSPTTFFSTVSFSSVRPTVGGTSVALVTDLIPTQTSLNGLSGIIDLVSPDNSITIDTNGQEIELTVTPSGRCLIQTFTPASGTLLEIRHNFNSEHFIWNLWRTDTTPYCTTIANIAPSGLNHASVQLQAPINGKLILQSCF